MFPTQPDESSASSEELQSLHHQEEETPVATVPIIGEGAASPIVEGQAAIPTAEAMLPPEAQGETNGGPLGCCLGTVVGLLLTALLLLGVSILLSNGGLLNFATIRVFILGTIAGGYFGWKIGKRVYKEYEPPIMKRQYRETPAKKKKRKVVKV
ncbi:MAG: hypothetical protein NVS9B9_08400 [Ktedonobacteraceae bacterium]